jgi:glycosyltransferase involved in cell wall biosynthesis
VVMPFPRLWTHLRLSFEMVVRPPDVLFVPAHVLPLIHPRRSVVTVMDLGYLYYPQTYRRLSRLHLDGSTRWNARRARRLVAISGATRDDLVSCYGVDPAKVTVVYPGVEGMGRVGDAEELRGVQARHGLPPFYLLYVGTLHPRKNLVRLVRAFGLLLGSWPSTAGVPPALVLGGKKGWLYDEIFAEVRRLGLEGRVLFPGYVPQVDLPALISGASAFVFPSLFEGFGFPILEAMACDVPVVCSRASCLPEVAGDAALLVDPQDEADLAGAMARVLHDEALRTALVARGRNRAAWFTWERCARETLAVLEGAAGSPQRR